MGRCVWAGDWGAAWCGALPFGWSQGLAASCGAGVFGQLLEGSVLAGDAGVPCLNRVV